MLDAFDYPIDEKTKNLVELLIPYEPDFSGGNGKVFSLAACAGERDLFRRMAGEKPDLDIVIPSLITAFEQSFDAQAVNGNIEEIPKHGKDIETLSNEINGTLQEEIDLIDGDADIERNRVHVYRPPELEDELSEESLMNTNSQGNFQERHAVNINEADNGDVSGQGFPELSTDDESIEETPRMESTAETILISYLEDLDDYAERGDRPLSDSLIFHAMRTFPEGRLLVGHLLDHGCKANSKVSAEIDPSGNLLRLVSEQDEEMTAVMWVLSRHEPVISDELALEILDRSEEGQ